jgi:diguanylate cyclase (GGDEF)-like protein
MNPDKKFSLLLVDDEKANLDVLSSILIDEYDLRAVRSGAAALEQAVEQPPDMILLDVLMPGMSGFEVLSKIKETDVTRNIPVIFITGLEGAGYEEKGLRLGAVDYITKPFNNGIVLAKVRTHMQIVRYIREIERLGMIDALTDIPNRRNFDVRIREEWRRVCRIEAPLSLLMIDVDNFKKYNDTYGYTQGDIVLQTIAKFFTAKLRRPSDFAARTGEDDFAVLLPGTDLPGAAAVAENIRADIEAAIIPCTSLGKDTSITVSIGAAAVVPTMEKPVEEFIQETAKKLEGAKNAGKNAVIS